MAFKICLIGCGDHAAAAHGPALMRYAREREGAQLSACCDIDEPRAAAFARRFGFARHYRDMNDMLREVRPDAAVMAVPVEHTPRLGAQALEAGIPLLLEKPPGRTASELESLIRARDLSGTFASVAFNRRHAPLARLARQWISELPKGSVHCLEYDMLRVGRRDPDFSTTAIHAIDAASFLLGQNYARAEIRRQPINGASNDHLSCDMDGGALVRINIYPATGIVAERVRAYAEGEAIFLNLPLWRCPDAPGRALRLRRGQTVSDVTGEQITDGPDMFETDGFYDENRAFLDAVRAGETPGDPLESAMRAVEIAQCMREGRDYAPLG